MPSSSRSTITECGTATTTCSAISSGRSSVVATRSCCVPGAGGTLARAARNPRRGVHVRACERRSGSGRPNGACASGRVRNARAERQRATLARPLHRRGDRVRPPSCRSLPRGPPPHGGNAAQARRYIAAAAREPLDDASPDGVSSLGRPQKAITVLREALALLRDQPELAHVRVACLGYLVFAAAEMDNRRDVQRWAVEATWLVAEAQVDESVGSAAAHTVVGSASRAGSRMAEGAADQTI